MTRKMAEKGRRTECVELFSLVSISALVEWWSHTFNIVEPISDVIFVIFTGEERFAVYPHHGGNDCGRLRSGYGPRSRHC